jgi:hypothetical protein
MKRFLTLVIGVVSLLAGIGLAYYAYANYARNIEVQQLPVPIQDIPPDTLLTADMFILKEYPRALADGFVIASSLLEGRVSAGLLPAGFPIPAPLAMEAAGFRLAPPEKTVLSIPITPAVAVGGEIHVGMHIDIYRLIPPDQTSRTTNLGDETDPQIALMRPAPIVEKIVTGVVVVGIFGDQGYAGQQNSISSNPLGSSSSVDSPARILVLALTPQEAQVVLGLMAETKRDALMWIGLTPLRGG